MKYTIEQVMKERLKYQSTTRALENYLGIVAFDFNYFTKPSFLDTYKTWPLNKQTQFLTIIGGKTNVKETKNYFENLNA